MDIDLPSTRELELETLIRQRDVQLAQLNDEILRLKLQLSLDSQPTSASEPISIPRPLMSLLLPHLNMASTPGTGPSRSSTVNTALTQRVRILQEENDELYALLKHGETGRLKDEVRGLRRMVQKLETAVKDSQQVVTSLSAELDKSYEAFLPLRQTKQAAASYSVSPRAAFSHPSSSISSSGNGNNTQKQPPTGPRAFKKPRVSEPQVSPSRLNKSLATQNKAHKHSTTRTLDHDRSHSPRNTTEGHSVKGKQSASRMDVDEDYRSSTTPLASKEKDRGDYSERRFRERDARNTREPDRERDRDSARSSRRNGGNFSNNGGGPGRGPRRAERGAPSTHPPSHPLSHHSSGLSGSDRSLAERMGL